MAYQKLTARDVPKRIFTTYTADDFSGHQFLSNKSFYETENKFMAGLWLHSYSKFQYVLWCAMCVNV